MLDAIRATAAEVLSDDGRHSKAKGHYGQKERLHHARADSETGLSLRSKAADDCVNEHDVNEEQQKLRARWDTDPQHAFPDFCLRPKQRKSEPYVVIFLFEINYHQHVGDQNRDERRERCAGDTEFWLRTDSKNQQRSQHDVQKYAEHLKSDSRLDDAGGSQRRNQRDKRK